MERKNERNDVVNGKIDNEFDGSDYRADLESALRSFDQDRVGSFAVSGIAKVPYPVIEINGVGRLGFPLSNFQASLIIKNSATVAPFGKGSQTLIDERVRKAWQINTESFRFIGEESWLSVHLPKIVKLACDGLGLNAEELGITANLYKMLLYEAGGRFLKHRDTERNPGMFGSLIVQLPAQHSGGDLVVELGEHKKVISFAENSRQIAFAGFFADCEHTLLPVLSGLRLVLAFNLNMRQPAPASAPIRTQWTCSPRLLKMQAAARQWVLDPNGPSKLLIPMAHRYTPTNLCPALLKGEDREMLLALTAATAPGFDRKLFAVHLALVQRVESRYGGDVAEAHMGDGWHDAPRAVADSRNVTMSKSPRVTIKVVKFVPADGQPTNLSAVKLDVYDARDNEFISGGDLKKLCGDPVSKTCTGYMGNYPGDLFFTYHAAVFVVWPLELSFNVYLLSGGFADVLAEWKARVDAFGYISEEDEELLQILVDCFARHSKEFLPESNVRAIMFQLAPYCTEAQTMRLLSALASAGGLYYLHHVNFIANTVHADATLWPALRDTVARAVKASLRESILFVFLLIDKVGDVPHVASDIVAAMLDGVEACIEAKLLRESSFPFIGHLLKWMSRKLPADVCESRLLSFGESLVKTMENASRSLRHQAARLAARTLIELYADGGAMQLLEAALPLLNRWTAACVAGLDIHELSGLIDDLDTDKELRCPSFMEARRNLVAAIPAAAMNFVQTLNSSFFDYFTLEAIIKHCSHSEAPAVIGKAARLFMQRVEPDVTTAPFYAFVAADVPRLWRQSTSAAAVSNCDASNISPPSPPPVWSALFNSPLFERHVLRCVAEFAEAPSPELIRAILNYSVECCMKQSPERWTYLAALRAMLPESQVNGAGVVANEASSGSGGT